MFSTLLRTSSTWISSTRISNIRISSARSVATVNKSVLKPVFIALASVALTSCGSGSGGGADVDSANTDNDVNPVVETIIQPLDDSIDTEANLAIPDDQAPIPGDFDITMPAVETVEPMEDSMEQGASEQVTENEPTSTDNESMTRELLVGLGETLSGILAEGEFITYRVPENSQVLLRSDTGDSDLFIYENQEFFEDELVCSATSSFQEDICSGSGSGDYVFATVLARESSDYTLSVTDDCSVGNINQWVYRSMQDYYLFADQVPIVDPLDYNSPSDLLRDLRFNELEPFSNIRDSVAQKSLSVEGMEFGFGYRWGRDSERNLRILNVYSDSPFGRAGVKRGDIFHSLGGVIDAELSNEQFFDFIGTEDEPLPAEWAFVDGETGELETFSATQTNFKVNTVAFTDVFRNSEFDGRTGYIVFNKFLNTSFEELNDAIAELRRRNITELVLDLRYNGGGSVAVAEHLVAQLSGNQLTGQVLSRRRFNNTYRHLDRDNQFQDVSPSLDLSRVIVLTTADTASASELVINSLQPYLPVITIGERSLGKPFISNRREFCGRSLNAMNSQSVNATDTSVAGGIDAMCFANDDRTRDFGIGGVGIEGMLEAALDFVVFGRCDAAPPTTTSIAARSSQKTTQKDWERTGGFDALGAFEESKPRAFVSR